eukprot:scaffold655_cov69-Phaeocystis_antarctica.AAC.1
MHRHRPMRHPRASTAPCGLLKASQPRLCRTTCAAFLALSAVLPGGHSRVKAALCSAGGAHDQEQSEVHHHSVYARVSRCAWSSRLREHGQ